MTNIEDRTVIQKRKLQILSDQATLKQKQKELLSSSILLNDIESSDNRYLLDTRVDKVIPEPKSKDFINSFKIEYDELEKNIVHVKIDYMAFNKNTLVDDQNKDFSILNTYQSPFKTFTKNNASELPTVYRDFFSHLFPLTSERDYVIDWLATSLFKKNLTYLCLFGNEGIGKGVFGGICKRLHLACNYAEIGDKTLKSDFNGEIKDKTIIFADEIKIITPESMNILKGLVNDTILINDKNEKKIQRKNYASVIICSNEWDAVKLNETSRRFSIPQVAEKKLNASDIVINKYENESLLCEQLFDDSNIETLFNYLCNLYANMTRDMNKALQGDYFHTVLDNQLSDWESFTLNYIRDHSPQIVTSNKIIEEMKNEPDFNRNKLPSRNRIFKFIRERFQKNIKVTRLGRQNIDRYQWIGNNDCIDDSTMAKQSDKVSIKQKIKEIIV